MVEDQLEQFLADEKLSPQKPLHDLMRRLVNAAARDGYREYKVSRSFGGAYIKWSGEGWEYTTALTTGMPNQVDCDDCGEIPWGLIETLRLEEPGLVDTLKVREELFKRSLERSTAQPLLDEQVLFAETMSWVSTDVIVETLPRASFTLIHSSSYRNVHTARLVQNERGWSFIDHENKIITKVLKHLEIPVFVGYKDEINYGEPLV